MFPFADMVMPDMSASTAPCVLCLLAGILLKYVHQKGGLELLASLLGFLTSPVSSAAPAVPANPAPAIPVGQGGTIAEVEADLAALKARVAVLKGQPVTPAAPPAPAA